MERGNRNQRCKDGPNPTHNTNAHCCFINHDATTVRTEILQGGVLCSDALKQINTHHCELNLHRRDGMNRPIPTIYSTASRCN
eukprot:scaffold2556_cov207-Alexandrium_tamarense.AAC.16